MIRIALLLVTASICAADLNRACESSSCGSENRPVCGSNCVTYRNDCELQKANCRSPDSITRQRRGECTCTPYGSAICTRKQCSGVVKAVCGTNRKTYVNDCELEKASCVEGWKIGKLSDAACRYRRSADPFPFAFPDPEPEPEAYAEPEPQGGMSNLQLEFWRYARRCSRLPPAPRPGAREMLFACPMNLKPICDSNGKQYDNPCAMAAAFCNVDGTIQVADC